MSDEYQELELLVQIAMASGEEYYLDGDKTTDYQAVAKALLDDDLEEFVNIVALTPAELQAEIDLLFSNPPDLEAPAFDEFNSAILELMEFESNRKKYILAKKAEGMTLDEAKEAYDLEKASMVRQHLDLPEPSEEE